MSAHRMLSVSEAKATLSAAIRDVEAGSTVVITRRRKPVAALIPVEDLEPFERLGGAGPDKGLASLAGGWEGADDLVSAIEGTPRRGWRREVDLETKVE